MAAQRQMAIRSRYQHAWGAWHACSACPIDSEHRLGQLSPDGEGHRAPAVRIVFVGGGGQRWTKWSQVVASGVRALEGFGRRAKRVPGPSQTGRGPGESRRSNSPADVLPPCRETLAFAGLARGRPHHQALVASRCRARYACSEALTSCRIAHASG